MAYCLSPGKQTALCLSTLPSLYPHHTYQDVSGEVRILSEALITWEKDGHRVGPLSLRHLSIFSRCYGMSHTNVACTTLLCSPPLPSVLGFIRETHAAT